MKSVAYQGMRSRKVITIKLGSFLAAHVLMLQHPPYDSTSRFEAPFCGVSCIIILCVMQADMLVRKCKFSSANPICRILTDWTDQGRAFSALTGF
jgi:hypothetical protein